MVGHRSCRNQKKTSSFFFLLEFYKYLILTRFAETIWTQSIHSGVIRIPNTMAILTQIQHAFQTDQLSNSSTIYIETLRKKVNEYSITKWEKCSTETVADVFQEQQIKVKSGDFFSLLVLLCHLHPSIRINLTKFEPIQSERI